MNDIIKVIFADDNNDFCEIVNDYFSTLQDIKIVGIAKNGLQAYEMILEKEPEIVVLDMVMPYIDGLGILEKLKECAPKRMPLIIFLSAIGQENITQRAISLGAQYYFVKPFNLDLLAERIRDFSCSLIIKTNPTQYKVDFSNKTNHFLVQKSNQVSSNLTEGFVTNLIRELGIPAHIKGYQFLRDAILMVSDDIDMLNSITKLVYPDIAKRYHTTATRVESAIRHGIEVAWECGDLGAFKRILGYDIVATTKRPSNSEFIATIIDTLRLEKKIV